MDQKLKLVDYQFLVHSALSMRASEGTVRKPPNRFIKVGKQDKLKFKFQAFIIVIRGYRYAQNIHCEILVQKDGKEKRSILARHLNKHTQTGFGWVYPPPLKLIFS